MNTQKIAITIPSDILDLMDKNTKQRSISRSKFISLLLREKLLEEKNRQLTDQYSKVFSDSTVCDEQLKTSMWLDGAGSREGQEW